MAAREIRALFHNVRSAYNVGALFRTADGAGVAKLYLSGYSPTPVDRFGRPQKDIAKTALGAERHVPWAYHKSPRRLIAEARGEGFIVVGVEQDPRAEDYRALKAGMKTLLVFGNEVRGLPPALRTQCDALIEIPMRGEKESLNVSVAAGIVLYQFSS